MLRSQWSRPPILRQFSTTASKWNRVQDPSLHDAKEEAGSKLPNTPAQRVPSEPSDSHRDPLTAHDLKIVKARIREWTEQATISLRNRADDFTAKSKTTFSQLGNQLNKLTGYEEIEALKRCVVEQGVQYSYLR